VTRRAAKHRAVAAKPLAARLTLLVAAKLQAVVVQLTLLVAAKLQAVAVQQVLHADVSRHAHVNLLVVAKPLAATAAVVAAPRKVDCSASCSARNAAKAAIHAANQLVVLNHLAAAQLLQLVAAKPLAATAVAAVQLPSVAGC